MNVKLKNEGRSDLQWFKINKNNVVTKLIYLNPSADPPKTYYLFTLYINFTLLTLITFESTQLIAKVVPF